MIKTRGVISGSKEKFHRFPLKHAKIIDIIYNIRIGCSIL